MHEVQRRQEALPRLPDGLQPGRHRLRAQPLRGVQLHALHQVQRQPPQVPGMPDGLGAAGHRLHAGAGESHWAAAHDAELEGVPATHLASRNALLPHSG